MKIIKDASAKSRNGYLKYNFHDFKPVLQDGILAFGSLILGLFVLPIFMFPLFKAINGGHALGETGSALLQIFTELPLALVALLFIKQFWEKLFLLRYSQEALRFLAFIVVGSMALFTVESIFGMVGGLLYQLFHNGHKLPTGSTNENALDKLKNANLFLFLILVIFVGPISEEVGMRLGIMNLGPNNLTPESRSVLKFILFTLSSALFGMMHVVLSNDWWHVFPYIGSGLAFASVYAFSGYQVHYSIGTHLTTNLIVVIIHMNDNVGHNLVLV